MGENQWVIENGVLRSPHSGANLITNQKFNDFKLHIEFRCPKGSNSGVYLRGRYEVQIEDIMEATTKRFDGRHLWIFDTKNGGQRCRRMAIIRYHTGWKIGNHCCKWQRNYLRQTIPGITGGALDSNEGEPGPIYIQGDHGPIELRNIVITPAK